MEYRDLGSTGLKVSALSFGTWAIGGSWGDVGEQEALTGLQAAIDAGVNFFDTADVYGDGRAERLIGQATKGKETEIHVATKFCRAADVMDRNTYSEKSVRTFCEGSLRRLGRDSIDLYQIHCPPHFILQEGIVFEVLEKLKEEGKIRFYGVSVESVDEGHTALNYTGVSALQVIFNIFRQKPLENLFPRAAEQGVGILARVPLASGLLTGKFTQTTQFDHEDHRNFNRDGQAFNVGETFAGLPFEVGVSLAQELHWIAERRGNMTRAALRWILDQPGITCAIPGFKTQTQVEDNLAAMQVSSFTEEELEKLRSFYHDQVKDQIRGSY